MSSESGLCGGARWRRRAGWCSRRLKTTKSKLQRLVADSSHSAWDRNGDSSSNVLEQLLANASATILGLLKLVDPVVDGSIQLGKSFFLLEERLLAKLDSAGGAEILADAGVKVAATGSQRVVGAAQVLAALIEISQLLEE